MTVKGGASNVFVYYWVMKGLKDGMTLKEAIEAVESTLHTTFPDDMKARIRQECQ